MAEALLTATTASPGRRLASGTGVGLALAVVSVATGATPAQAAEDYTVRPGDTVSHIAQRTSTSVGQIVAANGLDRRATIRAGQRLVIPQPAQAPAAPAAAPAARTHAVVSGDTVSAIAARYGTTVAAVVQANGLDSRAFIRAGQTLTIPTGAGGAAPVAASAPASSTGARTHTVARGETVSGIAARYGTTVTAVVQANGLDSRAFIRAGQKLQVPAGGGTSSAPATTRPTSGLVGSTFAGRTYPQATVASANQNKATLLELGVPSRDEMQALVRSTALEMGVDPALAQAIAHQESGFDQTAVSPANAIGTMQVIPSSGEWASDLVGRDLNLLDPQDNVVAGVAILRSLVATSPDLSTAIASYYQGQAGVRKHGMYPDTRRYVANVRTLMSRFA
ncbi:LysM peptidoglycan-binding domain-containing protein [Cellulomonas sp. APG4]|uniref:lytic transglycosylase domain-containing protein n=1 Tax=Cellulomonas sp. APG4 TaxID=1538656 RepID=UPI00137966A0|nr:lytic transglycosylase domain-containing protein [Cellulomonas sp. APG4]NCT90019.1 LysM peptidoglycan-binding domain-containing protein [Cellulomonas sp. APG4]